MIKHVTEIQSITAPIHNEKFEKALADHIRLIADAIDVAASKGQVCVKVVLTDHTNDYKIDVAVPDIANYNVLTTTMSKYMQMRISNSLAKLFTDNGYNYVSDDEDIKGFNVKYICIYWSDGLI